MALETPKWLTSALAWRWTPTLALLLGSLLYVGIAILVVPSEIDFSGRARADETGAMTNTLGRQRGLPSPRSGGFQTPGAADSPAEGMTDTPAAEATAADAEGAPRRSRRRRVVDPVLDPPPEQPAGEIVRPFDPNSAPPPDPAAQ